MIRVLLDTSFIIQIATRPVKMDVLVALNEALGGVELIVPDGVIGELNSLASSHCVSTRKARDATLALRYAEGLRKVPLQGKGTVDDMLEAAAVKYGSAVATLDSALIGKLKAAGVTVVTLRQGLVKAERGNTGSASTLYALRIGEGRF